MRGLSEWTILKIKIEIKNTEMKNTKWHVKHFFKEVIDLKKIFNWKQADIFVKNGCKVCEIGLGDKFKLYVGFEDNDKFNEMMKRWKSKEF